VVIETAEELLRRVNEGWRVYPEVKTGRWRAMLGKRSETIAPELSELAQQIYSEQARRRRELGDFREFPTLRSGRGAGGVAEVLKVLGEEYSAILKSVTEKTRWFTDALVNIGWFSTVAAFQFAKVDPKDIPMKVAEFADANNFVRFVVRSLSAMIEASSDSAKAIMEREAELTRYRNALKVMAFIASALRKQLRSVAAQLQIAHNIISRYGLLEEYLSLASQYAMVESLMSLPPPRREAGGEEREVEREEGEVRAG